MPLQTINCMLEAIFKEFICNGKRLILQFFIVTYCFDFNDPFGLNYENE